MPPIHLCWAEAEWMVPFIDAGGPAILAECRQIVSKIGTLPAGKAVITTGGRLAAKYVIHTVGPIYRGGEQWRSRNAGELPSRVDSPGRRACVSLPWRFLRSRQARTDIR